MKKIPSLFKRDYQGNRQVYNEVVEGSEWVLAGEGVATIKFDGTCCMVDKNGLLYKRYDRKLTKSAIRKKRKSKSFVPTINDFKPMPNGWKAAEEEPNKHTGHFPGWLPVSSSKPEDKYHVEALKHLQDECISDFSGTYELVGKKVQGNPYNLNGHELWEHGIEFGDSRCPISSIPPRDYDGVKVWFEKNICEGIVWHHPDGRMVKIKRKDFGLDWYVSG